MIQRTQQLLTSPWIICFVALVLRLAFFLQQAHQVPAQILATVPFENEAGSIAAALARGDGFCCLFRQPTGPTAWLTPVYPAFLAGIFKLFGTFTVASFYVAVLFNCIFSALACLPLFHAAKRISGFSLSILTAWAWAFFPSGIILPFEWIWETSLSALLASTILWATLYLSEKPKRQNFVFYGLLWGFCLLTNPSLGAVFLFCLLWFFFQRPPALRIPKSSILMTLVLAVVVCLPWTFRNAVQFHRFIPLRSNLPFELWMGNNPIYDEHSRQVNRITRYEQVHLYSELGETAYLREKGMAAIAFIRSHPLLCLQLAGKRAAVVWLGTSNPRFDFLRADSLLARFVLFFNALTILTTIGGLLLLYIRHPRFFLPIASFPLFFPLVYYFTQASLRLRHPCDPVLALLLALCFLSLFRLASSNTIQVKMR